MAATTSQDGSKSGSDIDSPLLEIKDLSVGYLEHGHPEPIRIIRDVSFTVGRREVVGLVGESGSGKTQTARAILKINSRPLRPLGGSICLDGVDLLQLEGDALRDIRGGRVSMIFQDPRASLNPLMRVGDQLARVYALHNNISRESARAETIRMLQRVGVAGPERVARSYPHQLSGGMCQRVMIGLSVGISPDLLIADEPTTGLDVTIQAQILELIQEVTAETGASVLVITHDLGVVAELCHRVVVMYAGRIVEIAPVTDLFANARHPYTIRLLSASLALDDPEKKSVDDAASVDSSTTFRVGSESYRASIESTEDPNSDAAMVEVSPQHWVLCTVVEHQGSTFSDSAQNQPEVVS